MSLAIRFGDDEDVETPQGIIYFDAVTKYGQAFKGSLTSHAIGSGGKISDHFIRENPVYSFTGIISGADISISKVSLTDENGMYPDNVSQLDITPVRIKDNGNALISLLPDTVASFFVDAKTSVKVDTVARKSTLRQIKRALEVFFEKDGITFVTLLEFKGKVLDKSGIIPQLVMTSLSFSEDENSGEALYVDITLEKPTMVSLQTTRISKSDIKKIDAQRAADKKLQSALEDKKPVTPDNPKKDVSSAANSLLPPEMIRRLEVIDVNNTQVNVPITEGN
jgi:hypothetical protein